MPITKFGYNRFIIPVLPLTKNEQLIIIKSKSIFSKQVVGEIMKISSKKAKMLALLLGAAACLVGNAEGVKLRSAKESIDRVERNALNKKRTANGR
jgi:hypothetical protein